MAGWLVPAVPLCCGPPPICSGKEQPVSGRIAQSRPLRIAHHLGGGWGGCTQKSKQLPWQTALTVASRGERKRGRGGLRGRHLGADTELPSCYISI